MSDINEFLDRYVSGRMTPEELDDFSKRLHEIAIDPEQASAERMGSLLLHASLEADKKAREVHAA